MSKPVSILFVCLGNICRSPLSHGVMQELIKRENCQDIFGRIDSVGMYGEPEGTSTHQGSQTIIKQKLGVKFSKASRHWNKSDYDKFDLILAMDQSNYADIMQELHDDSLGKVKRFRDYDPQEKGDVPDPYYSGGFDKVYDIIERTCKNIIQLHKSGKLT